MSHFPKILLYKILALCELNIGKEQFGFPNGLGFTSTLKFEFDGEENTKRFRCLKSNNKGNFDMCILVNLSATARMEDEITGEIPLGRDVRQG